MGILETILPAAQTTPIFKRDRFTWLAYLLLGYFAFLQSMLGPMMPFLRADFQVSYLIGSLHLSAFALGMVIIGLIGHRLVARFGYKLVLWGGSLGMGLGAILLVTGPNFYITILASLLTGLIGTTLLSVQQAALAYHHGQQRAIAFSEANIVASLASMLAPLLVGAAVNSGVGWRAAFALPILLIILLFVRERSEPVPEPARTSPSEENQSSMPLPRRFWAFWAVLVCSVAVEWSVGFWGTDYLHTIAGLPLPVAVTSMSIYFFAMLLGRIAGSRLTRFYPPIVLLIGVQILALVGVLLFWLAPQIILTLLGLGIAGFGIGNLFPLTLAVAVETSPSQALQISARVSLAGGLAILTAPLLLGSWAEEVGLRGAFTIVPILLGCACAIVFLVQRSSVKKG